MKTGSKAATARASAALLSEAQGSAPEASGSGTQGFLGFRVSEFSASGFRV